jgi:hypothetical protein
MRSFLMTEGDRKMTGDRSITILPEPALLASAGDRLP